MRHLPDNLPMLVTMFLLVPLGCGVFGENPRTGGGHAPCLRDSDCNSPEKCLATGKDYETMCLVPGRSTPGESCQYNDDCASGICAIALGRCLQRCRSNKDCPIGFACAGKAGGAACIVRQELSCAGCSDPDKFCHAGACSYPCETNKNCSSPGLPICRQALTDAPNTGSCVPASDSTRACSPSEFTSIFADECFTDVYCSSDSECPDGYSCYSPYGYFDLYSFDGICSRHVIHG